MPNQWTTCPCPKAKFGQPSLGLPWEEEKEKKFFQRRLRMPTVVTSWRVLSISGRKSAAAEERWFEPMAAAANSPGCWGRIPMGFRNPERCWIQPLDQCEEFAVGLRPERTALQPEIGSGEIIRAAMNDDLPNPLGRGIPERMLAETRPEGRQGYHSETRRGNADGSITRF